MVDQLFFLCKRDRGPDLIATSLADVDREKWKERLRPVVLIADWTVEPPQESFSYRVFDDGHAALVRRLAKRHGAGDSEARVLVGRADELSSRLATCLQAWSGWERSVRGNTMDAVPHADIVDACREQPLREDAKQQWEFIATVLGWLLAEPDRMRVVVHPQHVRPMTVMWALQACGEEALRDVARSARRWSFSTWEPAVGGADWARPEIVFVPPGVLTGAAADAALDPGDDQLLPAKLDEATGIVREFLFDEKPAVLPLVRRRRVAAEALRDAQTGRQVLQALQRIEQYSADATGRRAVRDVIGEQGLGAIVEVVDQHVPQELLASVAELVFGKGGVDIGRDGDAATLAAAIVERSRSELFARTVLEMSERNAAVSAAVVERFLRTSTPSKQPAVARRPHWAAPALVVAASAILLLLLVVAAAAFVLGRLSV